MWYFNYIRHLIILLQFSHALVCMKSVLQACLHKRFLIQISIW